MTEKELLTYIVDHLAERRDNCNIQYQLSKAKNKEKEAAYFDGRAWAFESAITFIRMVMTDKKRWRNNET